MSQLRKTAYAVYGKLPVLLQNSAISCWGMHSRHERYGGSFWRRLEGLRRSEWWSKGQMRAYQLQHLQQVVTDAYANTHFYRRLFATHGLHPSDVRAWEDLAHLPIVKKNAVRADPDALVHSTMRRTRLRTFCTSGTTGSPLKVYVTPTACELIWAVGWRHRARFGVRLGDPLLSFGIRMPIRTTHYKPPVWRENWAINQTYVSADHITPASLPGIVEMMNARRFLMYAGYPSAMYLVARYLLDSGQRLFHRPACVMSASEALSAEQVAVFEQAFGSRVTEFYGMAEGAGAMSRCEAGRFHEDFELGILEFLADPNLGDPDLRRIVVTGLHNPAMPFIRYDTGDVARVANDACPCGRQSPSVLMVHGRMHEFVRTPAGRYVVDMNQVFKVASHVREGHIVQNGPGGVSVLVVPASGFDAAVSLPRLEAQIRRRIGDDMTIDFKCVEHIDRHGNGKGANAWRTAAQA